jgi:AcrR family transcriptional regulator
MLSDRQSVEREARKSLIMAGALSVFHEKGIEGATMEQIAQEAGFGTASLYYYFPKKEDVFSAIMVKGWGKIWENCEPILPTEESPREKFLQILNSVVNTILDERNLYSFLFSAPQSHAVFEHEPWKEYQQKLYGTLRELLDSGMENGEFPKIEPEILFRAIGGSFHGILLMGDSDEKVSRKEIEKLFTKLLTSSRS